MHNGQFYTLLQALQCQIKCWWCHIVPTLCHKHTPLFSIAQFRFATLFQNCLHHHHQFHAKFCFQVRCHNALCLVVLQLACVNSIALCDPTSMKQNLKAAMLCVCIGADEGCCSSSYPFDFSKHTIPTAKHLYHPHTHLIGLKLHSQRYCEW